MLHRYEQNGLKIVIDVNSGAVHVVDQLTWDILDYYPDSVDNIIEKLGDKHQECNIREAWSEISELNKQGLLNSDDAYMDKVLKEKRETYTKALCLNIAHDCNIRCGYCFASTGDYHGGRKLMSFEVASKAIDFLLDTSGSRKRLEVDFFGGEPLMNFDVVRETVLYARKRQKEYGKRIGFTITTNGTLLNNEITEFINENMDNIVLSIDGRKQVNDRMRKFIDGSGTYANIMPKIKSLVESRGDKSYYIRGTFTANNLDFCSDVLHLADEGFKEISIEPVVAEKERGYALKEEHLPRIYQEYEKLAHKYIEYNENGKGFRYYHFLMDLDGGPCIYKRVSSCGSGVEYFAVTPDGELYPCHQFVGRQGYLMGDVWKGVTNKELQKEFSENTVYHKEKCRECWARFYCSGGCRANAEAFNNNLKEPYDLECKLQKKRIESAIMIKAYESLKVQD
ncbi:MAG: thioether cross-link-forming SCIFF peptide maturase [Clostridiaceae bacterium]|nr:thioether cross-link-forming SCIFF peptide maturase [Clostridiaceae bacterium]